MRFHSLQAQTLQAQTVSCNQANVTALDNLSVQGGDVQAKDINLIALGDVTIASAENRTTHEWTTTNKDCNWYAFELDWKTGQFLWGYFLERG